MKKKVEKSSEPLLVPHKNMLNGEVYFVEDGDHKYIDGEKFVGAHPENPYGRKIYVKNSYLEQIQTK